jgi:hypothetical protein
MDQSFRLSAAGLQSVIPDLLGTFDFIIGQTRYQYPLMNGAFLSPKIARCLATDRTFCEYAITTLDCLHCFDEFLLLGKGSMIPITPNNCVQLLQLAEELENDEICSFIRNSISRTDSNLTVPLALQHLRLELHFGFTTSPAAHFLSSHLAECSIDELRSLSVECLHAILSSESLSLVSEDWLCSVLLQLGSNYFSLFEFVHFEFLSPRIACEFAKMCESHFHLLNLSVWKAISARFSLPIVPSTFAKQRSLSNDVFHCSADTSGWLQGIVHHLQEKRAKNFSVSSSSVALSGFESGRGGPERAILLDQPYVYFASENIPGQWLMLDFQEMRVRVSEYTLRTHVYDAGAYHLKNWVLEGSVEAKSWKVLDTRSGNGDLNGKSRLAHFRISEMSDECRYVRVRATGLNHQNENYLLVGCFEIFGDLINFQENA